MSGKEQKFFHFIFFFIFEKNKKPMKIFAEKLEADVDQKIHFITLENKSIIPQAEASMHVIDDALRKLKNQVLKHKFKTPQDEIFFFKVIKPQLLSRLIYHSEIYHIESQKPHGGKEITKDYYITKLKRLRRYTEDNLDFYKYYRGRRTYMDHKYFIRGDFDLTTLLNTTATQFDKKFCTSHDYSVAKILANDRLEIYLTEKLEQISASKTHHKHITMQWSDTKAGLVELIYALYYSGVLKDGRADIKEITRFFENVFEIKLGDVYRTFAELKLRNNPARFLDSLRNVYVEKITEEMK